MSDTMYSVVEDGLPGNEPPPGDPPLRVKVLYRVLNWRVPPEWRAWAARDIASPRFRRHYVARIMGWFLVGLVINWIVNRVVLDPGVHYHRNYLFTGLLISTILLVATRGSLFERRRRKAFRWQRVTPDGEPLPPGTGGGRAGNGAVVLSVALILASVTALNVQGAQGLNRRGCFPPALASSSRDLAELMTRSQPGFNPIPDGSAGTGRFTAADAVKGSLNPSNTKHLLSCLAFADGYARAFTATAAPRRGFSVTVYQFSTAPGATRYAAAVVRGTLRHPSAARDVPPGRLITLDDPDKYGNRVGYVIGAVGPYAYIVRLYSASATPDFDEAVPIAEGQRQALGLTVS